MQKAPILFLDFDGVLSSGFSGDFVRLPLLRTWLDPRPDVHIVVTSDWRKYHDLDTLRHKMLGEGVGERVLGVTPHDVWHAQSTDAEFMYPRQKQIIAWRRAHRHTGRFAAIDDMPGLFAPDWPYLVLTDSRTGLTEQQLARVDALLEL